MLARYRLTLGSVKGIPISIDLSWALVAVLVIWGVAENFLAPSYPNWTPALTWGTATLASILLFLCVLGHELAHSLVARSRGLPVKAITLFVFGGVSELSDEPASAGTELLVALAGPLASLLIGGIFYLIAVLSRQALEPVHALTSFLAQVNLSLGLFNLIPGFPLDGGRVLRAAIWGIRKDIHAATRVASRIGQFIALLFATLGIITGFAGDWFNGLWLILIGSFLNNAAQAAYGQSTLRRLLEGHVVSEAMSSACQFVPPQLTLDVFVENYLVGEGRRCFPVGTSENVLGLLTVHDVRRIPVGRWREARVGEVMTPWEKLRTVSPTTGLWEALRNMTEDGVNQLPVLSEGKLVGMISRENLVSFLHGLGSIAA